MLITFDKILTHNGNLSNVDKLKTLFKTPSYHLNASSKLEEVSQCPYS